MIDVANLRPSDVETILEEGVSLDTKNAILAGVSRMLKEIRPDQGADSDRIHLAASMLGMARVWEAVSPSELARAIDGGHKENVTDFLQGLPAPYGREVAFEMVTSRDKAMQAGSSYQAPVYRDNSEKLLEFLKKWRARRSPRSAASFTHVAVVTHASAEKDLIADADELVIEDRYRVAAAAIGRSAKTGEFAKTGRFTASPKKRRGFAIRRRMDT
ncbi:hypothetical protein [Rhizobium phage RHph_X66]|nr:hypothetical protein [Rhizobium phage RHph_X66]